jgi:hypothetical protein
MVDGNQKRLLIYEFADQSLSEKSEVDGGADFWSCASTVSPGGKTPRRKPRLLSHVHISDRLLTTFNPL